MVEAVAIMYIMQDSSLTERLRKDCLELIFMLRTHCHTHAQYAYNEMIKQSEEEMIGHFTSSKSYSAEKKKLTNSILPVVK